jgi:hypothetical protein
MKKLLLGLFFFCLTGVLTAQSETAAQKALQSAEALAPRFQLDEAQRAKLYRIQTRRYSDLELIAANKASDPALYLDQLKAVEKGSDFSIELMLREDQLPLFRAYALEKRTRRSEKAQAMLKQGVPIQQVEIAMYELE